MDVSRRSALLLLGIALLATALQGVQGEEENDGPSESQCRPYIEKALKEIEIKPDVPVISDDSKILTGDESDKIELSNIITEQEKESKSEEQYVSLDNTLDKSNEENDIEKLDDFAEQDDHYESNQGSSEKNNDDERNQSETIDVSFGHEQHVKNFKDVDQVISETEEIQSQNSNESEENLEQSHFYELDQNKANDGDIHISSEQNENIIQEDTTSQSDEDNQMHNESSEEIKNAKDDQELIDSTYNEDKEEIMAAEEVNVENIETITENDKSDEHEMPDQENLSVEPEEDNSSQTVLEKETSKSGEEEILTSNEEIISESTENVENLDTDESVENAERISKRDTRNNEQSLKSEEEGKENVIDNSLNDFNEVTNTESKEDLNEADKSSNNIESSTEISVQYDEDTKVLKESIPEEVIEKDSNETETEELLIKEESIETSNEIDVKINGNLVESEEINTTINLMEDEAKTEIESEQEVTETEPIEQSSESLPEEELTQEFDIPTNLRSKDHIHELLKLDEESSNKEKVIAKAAETTLRELKRLYENAIKPLEVLYKYRDLSNRHFGDSEIFSKPLVLFMGPWSGGKSSIINYLTDNEFTTNSLRTGAEPSPAYFNIVMWGEEPEVLDGTQLAADFTFAGLQKFGQGLEERLRGQKLPSKLLEKVNIVEIPGILEVRKQVSRVFPFNDACQWFIDRADIIFLVYDPSKLDVGPETEAILDQLKGREHQTRIILNKADQVKPEELMRVQGALIWNISPLMSSAQPPIMYTTSLWSRPFESWAPIRLLLAQERALLRDLRSSIDKRIENKIASARRFAVRVRNHAKMVDCYLTTYYNHKSVFGNKKVVADSIIEHPQDYHIYEGLSTLTNISRYDLPDPDVYRDFFRLNALYDFQQLAATCTYFRGCPINRLDVAIAYDLPELVGKHKKLLEAALVETNHAS